MCADGKDVRIAVLEAELETKKLVCIELCKVIAALEKEKNNGSNS